MVGGVPGAHAIGGMAAFVANRSDENATKLALARGRADKQREAGGGFDGSWVAHPGLLPTARGAFDRVLGDRPNQIGRQRPEVRVRAANLLTAPPAHLAVTMQSSLTNISVALQYLAAWVDGSGAVAIDNLMEDAAAVGISRAQVWQWIHNKVVLPEGPTVTRGPVQRLIEQELARLGRDVDNRVRPHLAAAADIFTYAALGDTMPGFFTQYGYVKYVLEPGHADDRNAPTREPPDVRTDPSADQGINLDAMDRNARRSPTLSCAGGYTPFTVEHAVTTSKTSRVLRSWGVCRAAHRCGFRCPRRRRRTD